MPNSVLRQGLSHKLLLVMPGLSTVLAAASVVFFHTASPFWRTDLVEGITAGTLLALSSFSFLAICKATSSGA